MPTYSKGELEGFSERDLSELLEEEDIITDIYVQGVMGFSSYTGMLFDIIDGGTKLVFGGQLAIYKGRGPFNVIIKRKVHNGLILGFTF